VQSEVEHEHLLRKITTLENELSDLHLLTPAQAASLERRIAGYEWTESIATKSGVGAGVLALIAWPIAGASIAEPGSLVEGLFFSFVVVGFAWLAICVSIMQVLEWLQPQAWRDSDESLRRCHSEALAKRRKTESALSELRARQRAATE
jgi:hypothetical protein